MEIYRRATAPGKKYPSFGPEKKRVWLTIVGGAVCLILWMALRYFRFAGDMQLALVIVLPFMAAVILYLLMHRIRAYLDPIEFQETGFLWRGELHPWESIQSVRQYEMSNGLRAIELEYSHAGIPVKRSIWLHENQGPHILAAELSSLSQPPV
jgi:hypothetical protein